MEQAGSSPAAVREARAAEARARAAARRAARDSKRDLGARADGTNSLDAEQRARQQARAKTLAKLKERSRSQQGMAEIDQSDWLEVASPKPRESTAPASAASSSSGTQDSSEMQHPSSSPASVPEGQPMQPPTAPTRPIKVHFSAVCTSRVGGAGVTVGWAITTGSSSDPVAPAGWHGSREWSWEAQYGKRVDTWHDVQPSDWAWQAAGGGWCGTVEGLIPGTSYSIRVRALAGGIPGPWSKKSDLIAAEALATAAPAQPLSTAHIEDGSPLSAMLNDVRVGEWEAALAHLKLHTHPDDEEGWMHGEVGRDPTLGEAQRIVELVHVAVSHADVPVELVHRLLLAHPRAIQEKLTLPPAVNGRLATAGDGLELLPLQRGLFAAVSPAVLDILLNPPGYSEAAARVLSRERCAGKLNPLHIASGTPGTTTMALEALLAVHPKATGEREDNGLFPLHVAIWNHMPLAIVQLLLERTPGGHRAVTSKEKDSMWPLHVAASVCVPRPLLEWLIAEEPKALRATTRSGRTVLHCALTPTRPLPPNHPPLDWWEPTLEIVMDAAPDLLHSTDTDGRTPLHLALWNSDPVSIIRKVIERASEITLERDSAGLTPLATAVGRGADVETVKVLLAVGPGATQIKSNAAFLPLHEAAAAGASTQILRDLVGADVSTLAKPTAAGDLPLHLALDSTINHSAAAVAAPHHYPGADFAAAAKCLAMAYPPAATILGSRSRRPFELAAECGADEALQEMLFAMAEHSGKSQRDVVLARESPKGRGEIRQGAGTRAPQLPSSMPPASATMRGEDTNSFEAHEAAEMQRLSGAVRMAEARIEGLKVEVKAWRAEAAEKEQKMTQGSAAAKHRAESEVAAEEARVAALRAEAEKLTAAVKAMTATLDEREEQIEQLEEALEWQETL